MQVRRAQPPALPTGTSPLQRLQLPKLLKARVERLSFTKALQVRLQVQLTTQDRVPTRAQFLQRAIATPEQSWCITLVQVHRRCTRRTDLARQLRQLHLLRILNPALFTYTVPNQQ